MLYHVHGLVICFSLTRQNFDLGYLTVRNSKNNIYWGHYQKTLLGVWRLFRFWQQNLGAPPLRIGKILAPPLRMGESMSPLPPTTEDWQNLGTSPTYTIYVPKCFNNTSVCVPWPYLSYFSFLIIIIWPNMDAPSKDCLNLGTLPLGRLCHDMLFCKLQLNFINPAYQSLNIT